MAPGEGGDGAREETAVVSSSDGAAETMKKVAAAGVQIHPWLEQQEGHILQQMPSLLPHCPHRETPVSSQIRSEPLGTRVRLLPGSCLWLV